MFYIVRARSVAYSEQHTVAYKFVNCTLGCEEEIIAEISKVPDIKEVRGTYGVHDVFVKVKSDLLEAMNHTIKNKIRKIPGITSTVTLLVIDEQGVKECLIFTLLVVSFYPLR